MGRKINGKLLLFFVLVLILGIALLGVLARIEQGPGSFQAKLYGTPSFFDRGVRVNGPEDYLGMLAFAMIAAACYGIYKVFQGIGTDGKVTVFRMPSFGCIVLSVLLIGIGCLIAYLEVVQNFSFGRRYRGLSGIIFVALGCLVFYRGIQGKEYRFWSTKWKPLGEAEGDPFVPKKKEEIICMHCKSKLVKKEAYCPVCGRKIAE